MWMFEFVSYILQVFWPGQTSSINASPRRPRCDWVFAPAPRELDEHPANEVGTCPCDACIEAFTISIDTRRTYWRRADQLRSDVPHHHPGWYYQERLGWLFDSWNYDDREPAPEPVVQEAAPPQPMNINAEERMVPQPMTIRAPLISYRALSTDTS